MYFPVSALLIEFMILSIVNHRSRKNTDGVPAGRMEVLP